MAEVLTESGNENVDETGQVVSELVHDDAPEGSITPEGADAHSVGRGKGRGLVETDSDVQPDPDGSGKDVSDDDSGDGELTGDALNKRAAELEIEGRGSMSADEKRKAITKAESA